MTQSSYLDRRDQLELYFDRTAAKTWEHLTSDAPVSRVRRSVRAGRDSMREQLLAWLPQDMRGRQVLDAGCGTGAYSVALAQRGFAVTGIDNSPDLLREAAAKASESGATVDFLACDIRRLPARLRDRMPKRAANIAVRIMVAG